MYINVVSIYIYNARFNTLTLLEIKRFVGRINIKKRKKKKGRKGRRSVNYGVLFCAKPCQIPRRKRRITKSDQLYYYRGDKLRFLATRAYRHIESCISEPKTPSYLRSCLPNFNRSVEFRILFVENKSLKHSSSLSYHEDCINLVK